MELSTSYLSRFESLSGNSWRYIFRYIQILSYQSYNYHKRESWSTKMLLSVRLSWFLLVLAIFLVRIKGCQLLRMGKSKLNVSEVKNFELSVEGGRWVRNENGPHYSRAEKGKQKLAGRSNMVWNRVKERDAQNSSPEHDEQVGGTPADALPVIMPATNVMAIKHTFNTWKSLEPMIY